MNILLTSIAKKTNSNIKFSPKHCTDYQSFANKISFIIYSLDSHKSPGPHNIPVKILKLPKNDLFQQLVIFLMFF